ncbi:MAG: hypothetical protein J7K85_01745 [Anaerolineaceae bacterium]|nr:hypothetical protein [Anaerolineaceae bacterium]
MKKLQFVLISISLLFSACEPLALTLPRPSLFGIPTYPSMDKTEVHMGIEQTAAVMLTQSAFSTQLAFSPTPKNDIVNTPEPLPTPAPTEGITQKPKDIALLLGVISIQDGTEVFPEEGFDKIWRIRNVGETDWNSDYSLVFVSGDQMGAPRSIPIGLAVRPGDMVDVRLHLTAPENLGEYNAVWMLRSPEGELIGMGSEGEEALTISITVIKNPLHSGFRQALQFYKNFSKAEWYDQNGVALCEADGNIGAYGYVYRDNAPLFQNDIQENEPALVMIPAEGEEGFIAGKFSPFIVNAGDYFVSRVACLAKGTLCDVTFKVAYQVVGEDEITIITEVHQTANGEWTEIRKNLTYIAGSEVQFILIVENNQLSKGDFAAWFVPAIYR